MRKLFTKEPSKSWIHGLTKDMPIQRSIALMLFFPVGILIWAYIFEVKDDPRVQPIEILFPPIILVIGFIIYGFYYIYKNRNYRFATIFYFLMTSFLMLISCMIGIMTISGNFL
jgi:hypothetical protein